jgi:hypothetical protein
MLQQRIKQQQLNYFLLASWRTVLLCSASACYLVKTAQLTKAPQPAI